MSYEEEDTCHMRPCTARDLQLARSEVRKSVKRDLHLGKVSQETYISGSWPDLRSGKVSKETFI